MRLWFGDAEWKSFDEAYARTDARPQSGSGTSYTVQRHGGAGHILALIEGNLFMTCKANRTGKCPPRTNERAAQTPPREILKESEFDRGLNGQGLTYALHLETDEGMQFRSDADWPVTSAMLFAVRAGIRIDRELNRYLHYGRPSAHRKTTAAVLKFVRRLRRKEGLRFILVWHVGGESSAHLDYTPGMTPAEIEKGLERLAWDELRAALFESRENRKAS